MASSWPNDSATHPNTDEPGPSGAAARGGMGRSIIVWCGIGFAAGSLFWTAVTSPQLGHALRISAPPQHTASIPEPGKLPDRLSEGVQGGPGCIALVLDRSGRETRADHCPGEELSLQHLAGSGRQDRLVSEVSAAGTDPETPLPENAPGR